MRGKATYNSGVSRWSIWRWACMPALVACLAACGDVKQIADADADGTGDTGEDEDAFDAPVDTPGDEPADPDVDEEETLDAPEDLDALDVEAEDVEEEEVILEGCGDGERDSDEVCDDGNDVTEPCGTTDPAACLADCSLLMGECGDAGLDVGEQCDDGNDDPFDGCTSSCTTNIHGIGAPCECISGCDPLDFTRGVFTGCENAELLGDTTRTLACVRSSVDPTYGETVYSAGGFCTVLAIGCSGTLCWLVPTTGDVSTFPDCPLGFAVRNEIRVQLGMTVTVKSCHPICDALADCRWNAVESSSSPWPGDCGQYECLPVGYAGRNICIDPRNISP